MRPAIIVSIAALAFSLFPAVAPAAEEAAGSAPEAGTETRNLLELQRSGQSASDTERPLSGDVAQRVNKRYAESFSQPIPKSLSAEEQSFVKDKR